jgi:sortase (surface protein transpeptidase)
MPAMSPLPSLPSAIAAVRLRPGTRLARLSAVALGALVVASLVAPGASAESIRRTWTARFGAAPAGTARIVSYTSGTGSLVLDLSGLQPSAAYSLLVYRGTCAAPVVVTRLPGLRADTSGAAAKTTTLTTSVMNAIWTYGRSNPIALRLAGGAGTRCAALTYPVATRVAIPSLAIDLPVIRAPSGYPLCNVAMYIKELSQPREAGVTLIYAHARTGMFLPLLDRSKVNDGASLVGMRVRVWTSDDVLSTYEIVRVRRHVTSLDGVFGVTSEQLWLQTSEGPRGTTQKLIVVARRLSSVTATHAAAHPAAHPVVCG